jgi:hypothetical protein
MAAKIFISYSHVDKAHIERLHNHLAQLERDDTVAGWFDREITAGGRLDEEIKQQLESSDIFLACASPDYIASNYCYDKELEFALQREQAGELFIVPVILEHCEWLETPLSKFKAVPEDGKPIADYTNPNVALLNVATEIRRLCRQKKAPIEVKSSLTTQELPTVESASRYRVKREFDKLHKRDFVEQAFAEIYAFFEASAQELQAIPDVEARLTKTGEDRFSCTVINRGIARGFETLHVRRGGSWGAIDILYGEKDRSGTSNGGFSVVEDDYQLYLSPSMFSYSRGKDHLSAREAAQMLWDDLLSKVGIDYA